jgi:hypothetical protein
MAVLLFAATVLSCSENKTKVMSQGKFEDVLFDYHLADAMVHSTGVVSGDNDEYLDAVLEKHSVTRAEFDSSMVYYMKYADKMLDIYTHLSDRMSNEARLQGIDGNNLFDGNVLTGDTANIWNSEKARVFSDKGGENMMRFRLTADSTYHKGDRITLAFKTDFLYQDGARNGYAVMSVKFSNDSVATRTSSLSSSTMYRLEISDDTRIGIKEIRGFIMQRKSNVKTDRNNQTLMMMIVSDIRLIRMHTPEPAVEPAAKDSARTVNDNKIQDNENEIISSVHPIADTVHRKITGVHQLHRRQ